LKGKSPYKALVIDPAPIFAVPNDDLCVTIEHAFLRLCAAAAPVTFIRLFRFGWRNELTTGVF
jgi:hypothetical protein